ncbi:hypothetical protein BDM02DRAFT_3188665 [Thelephora ganbajun]|uniref:Uncharacterized protein n=1 Tax=Thelephora ganbajun TaxID=370292 RepID=A0ACB6ZAJ6_THEGA|nr:hypothetical protein BDM02DRAFT_3188665 [Thelephora ganbajun]
MAGAAMLKVGQGFGTWLIPIIIFGVFGFVAVVSLITFVYAYSCRPRRRITDQEPEMTHEIYRTPTTPYKDPSDRPVDPTIGRLITHSRSLHVPRNQLVNGHRLRSQVSSPELRNTSQPPPYTYRAMPSPSPYRNPRPHGQVYFDQIFDPGHPSRILQQSQQPTSSSESSLVRPRRCFSVSSPSSHSSTRMSAEGPVSVEAFSPSSTPRISSQGPLTPARTPSWVEFPEPYDSDSDSYDTGSLLTPSSHNELAAVSSVADSYETEFKTAEPRRRLAETGDRTGHSGQNNRRLIIVDNNLVSGDSEVPSHGVELHTFRRVEVSRPVRDTLERRTVARATAVDITANEEAKEAQVEKPPQVRHNKDRGAIFKVICPDTSDLWKMPVVPGETLDRFADRVKQKTGGDVILFMDDEILASEEDWEAAKGGGRIVAHLIR